MIEKEALIFKSYKKWHPITLELVNKPFGEIPGGHISPTLN